MLAHNLINGIENLEPRFLLSGSFASLNVRGVLGVVGDSKSNVISVVYSGSNVKVTRDGVSLSFDKTKVKSIWAEGFGGNDKITIGVPLPSTLIGDSGNDTLTGNVKNDELDGGSGDDHLIPGYGSNVVNQGSGNDLIDYSNLLPGTFVLTEIGLTHPGGGTDIVGNTHATVLLTPGNDTFIAYGVSGDLDSNLIIDGGAGNDSLSIPEVGANAHLYGLEGGAGNDTFSFSDIGGPPDFVDGGSGDDVINHSDAHGTITADGGSGYDTYNLTFDEGVVSDDHDITVPPGFEAFNTEEREDLIIRGNDLDNVINASAANVSLYGNGGNDRLTADTSTDPYSGTPNPFGTALLDGGSGNDTLIGTAGTTFKGGSGTDTADFSAETANLKISLDNVANDGAAGDHDNVMADVENVIGGSGNDLIIGNPFANNLQGGSGNDTLWGGAGNDTLTGGPGHDKLYGQDGNDTIYAKDGHTDTLDGGNGTDKSQRDNTSTIKDSVLNIESFI